MRILFVSSNRVGDAVLSTGLLSVLIARHPHARITVACGPAAAGLFERMPNLEAVWEVEKRSYNRHWLGLWSRAMRHRWDLVVDMRGSAIGFLVPARARALLHRGTRRSPEHKIVEIARVLRLPPPPPPPVVWVSDADRATVAALLPPRAAKLIVLGPTANWTGKLWPPDRFAALVGQLGPLLPNAVPVLLAGPGEAERALVAPVLAGLPGAVDLGGRLTLAEAAACLERASVFIGNDSGLMHLAAAAGAPTVGLFGPTPAAEYSPVGACATAVVSPTRRMDDIAVAAVVAAVGALLGYAEATSSGLVPAESSVGAEAC